MVCDRCIFSVNNIFNNLSNIKLFPYQKRELMPLIYSSADIHFILINELMDQDGFPSKVYSIMATSKPLIVVTKENSPIYNFLNKLDCSILICKNKNIELENLFKLINPICL